MLFNQRQQVQQTQQLKLTPVLTQAIDLLHYSQADLSAFIKEQIKENPFIAAGPIASTALEDPINWLADTSSTTLDDYLWQQIQTLPHVTLPKLLLLTLIGEIDENGYFYSDHTTLALKLHCSIQELEDALQLLKQLDPPGIGAESVRECLLLQLERQTPRYEAAYQIVRDAFPALVANDWPLIQEQLDLSSEAVELALTRIQSLNPRPGADFSVSIPSETPPDIVVNVEGEIIHCQLNMSLANSLQFDQEHFEALEAKAAHDPAAQKFLNEQKQQYQSLKQMLSYREEHLLTLSQLIIQHQNAFFRSSGDSRYLHPFAQQAAAKQMAVHPSTVSRLVQEKTLSFQGRIYPFRLFFPRAVTTHNQTSEQIQQRIQQLISHEPSSVPLSDQKIAQLLHREDIHISRRLVAKYRKQLGIPASYLRKR
ncbi:MAG: RNA polymerase factor sigma-54 [Aerococcus sp.]|nr:RNA polymerase factor sigma-54 [Aerococcus sp.]